MEYPKLNMENKTFEDKLKESDEFKKKYKYPNLDFCPNCGAKNIKENSDISFRCRKCQTEFIIWVTYDPKQDRNYWFDSKKQILKPDYFDKQEREQDIKRLSDDGKARHSSQEISDGEDK